MYCLPCFNRDESSNVLAAVGERSSSAGGFAQVPESSHVQVFNFRELAMATKTFRQECLLGEGGFGRVYKGQLRGSDQVVAVKKLDRNGMEESKEFKAEAMKLSHLNHPNLVKLIGYCADGDQRLLVYEYMPMGSLEQHLYGDDPAKKPLDWVTRMKIASGAAQGLQYLHENADPPVVYGDFKPSNVLLSEDFEPKLSDVGLSKLGAVDGKTQASTSRMMGTFGYSSPEYSRGEEVTIKSDIYSFGVVLLELITGRRAIDTTRPTDEQNLVTWAQPFFKDPKRFSEMADPNLQKDFPATSLNQAVGIAAMCLQDEPMVRPHITDVTSVLSCISMVPNNQVPQFSPPPQQKMEYEIMIHSDTPSTHEDEEDIEQCDDHSSSSGCPFSDGESGSDSDEESTCPSSRGSSVSDAVKKQGASSRKKHASSHKTVVTFKEPSPSSRYSANGTLEKREESSGSSGQGNSE